jgi:hypothetical protein
VAAVGRQQGACLEVRDTPAVQEPSVHTLSADSMHALLAASAVQQEHVWATGFAAFFLHALKPRWLVTGQSKLCCVCGVRTGVQ